MTETEPLAPPRADPPARRWPGLVVGMLVMLVTFVGHDIASSSHAGGDTLWTPYQAFSLIKDQTLTLSRWEHLRDPSQPLHHQHTNKEGDSVSNFPWGTAVVATPVVAVLAAVEALQGRSLEDDLRHHVPAADVENTVASVLVALTAGLIFLIARWESQPPLVAGAVALTAAFATSAFSTASRALWSNGAAMLVIAAEVALLVRARPRPDRPRRDRLVPLLGPLFVLAYAVRPTTAVVAVALTGVAAVVHRRRLPLLILGGAAAGAAFVAVNLATYQQYEMDYYDSARLTGSKTFWEALAGNLISPQRGLLVWSPIVLLAGAGIVVALRRRTFDVLLGGLVAAVVLYWLVISTLQPWWAGFSVGPRLFTDVIPLFVVMALPAVDALRHSHWFPRIVVVPLLAFSLFTNQRGATRFETQLWNPNPVDVHKEPSRIWDWDDLQFLR